MWWILAALVLLWALSWLGKRLLPDDAPHDVPAPDGGPDDEAPEGAGAYELHVGDELDLHGVDPREVGALVDAFVDASQARGRRHVRIVHGKGIGALRAQVRARLECHAAVRRFADAPPPSAWGATVVELRSARPDVEADRPSD